MPLVNCISCLQEFPANSDMAPAASFATYEDRRVAEASNEGLPTTHIPEPGCIDTDKFDAVRTYKRSIQKYVGFASLDRIKQHKLNLQVIEACIKSDIPELEKLHNTGLNVSSSIRIDLLQEFNPLHHAAEVNDKELFLFLLDVAEVTDSFEEDIHFHVNWLIQHDKVDFIQLLEDRKLLSDDYCIIHDSRKPIPMINIAINEDATQVIEWLLSRNVDLTKMAYTSPGGGLYKISGRNAFDLAFSKNDLTLLYKLLFNFAGANANTKSLPVTSWVRSLACSSGIDDFAIALEILKNFQNFQEITILFLEEGACDNIEILEFLFCKFSKTVFHNLENMRLSRFIVMKMLGIISNTIVSKYGIDHLQMLIQNRLPDLEGANWLLDCCFKYSNVSPKCPALFKEQSVTTWLIMAFTRLGAEITTAEYHPALLAIKEDETPYQKPLAAVKFSTDLKDSRESHVVSERPSYKEVDEKLELFFNAVLTNAMSIRERST